jgi:hypothetical protein
MLLETIIGEWSLRRKPRRKENDAMQEHSKREESLSEELLEGITGGTGGASGSGRTQGPTSFLNCRECRSEARRYGLYINVRDQHQNAVDFAVSHNNNPLADVLNQASNQYDRQAQGSYQKMEAHRHPDFPAALRQQRQNYNPPL